MQIFFFVYLFFFLFLAGCSSQFAAFKQDKEQKEQLVLQDMRVELADVKHSLNSHKVELEILEEKVANSKNSLKIPPDSKLKQKCDMLQEKLAYLEKKLDAIEKSQEKVIFDLKTLHTHSNQTSQSVYKYQEKLNGFEQEIASHREKIEGLVKLNKNTLASLSKIVQKNDSSGTSFSKTYKVREGDSLEKIARAQHTSVDTLIQFNQLKSDKIIVGQELKIP